MKPKVIVIVGPTASGKTAVSIELAKRINGEIISADSMQVYKYMNIGTAKPTTEEMDGIKHYLLDVVSPDEVFNVAKYKTLAEEAIDEKEAKKLNPKVDIIEVDSKTGLGIDKWINYLKMKKELK